MSNPKPVEGALRNYVEWMAAQRCANSLATVHIECGDCETCKARTVLLKQSWLDSHSEAALSAAARCNRCAADLCEHDNCTDWTCARACGKCAPWPAPARDGVREAAQSTKEYAEQCARDLLTRLFNEHYGSGEAKWFRHALRRNLEPMLVKELLLFGQFIGRGRTHEEWEKFCGKK